MHDFSGHTCLLQPYFEKKTLLILIKICSLHPSLSVYIVMSPLVGLCRDEVQSLAKLGVKVIYLRDVSNKEWKKFEKGIFSLVYSSLEMLLDDKCAAILMGDLYTDRFCRIFIDEVHCVTKW